jgi:ATP-binding cassette, subfamily B, bacterial
MMHGGGGTGGGGGGVFRSAFPEQAKPRHGAGPVLRQTAALFARYRAHVAVLALTITVASLIGLAPPLIIRTIIDDAIPHRDGVQVDMLVIWIIVASLGGALLSVGQTWLNNIVGQNIMEDVRNRMYARMQRMSLRFLTSTRGGEIQSRLTNDVNAIQDAVTNSFTTVLSNAITVVSTIALMTVLDWRFTLLAIAALPLFIYPTRRVGAIQRRLLTRQQEQLAQLSAHSQETLSINGALLMKLFGREPHEYQRYRAINREVRDLSIRRALVGRWFFMLLGLFGALVPALVYWYGGHAVINADMQIGTVVALAAYVTRLFTPVTQLLSTQVTVESSLALFERIFEYSNLPVEIEEAPHAIDIPRARGQLEFDHVSFQYVPGRWALQNVSFSVEPGQMTALVGPSGAGKTTITYLTLRLFDVTKGAVRLDGVDVRELTLTSLARNISMVTQESFLLHDTLRENIRYGKPSATDDEVMAAARTAQLEEMVSRLPKGLDTVVGERGYRLSGGEKQRVAIARVLLKDPPVLVLDEATSSLDSQSERLIQQALRELMLNRTTIVIAHRLSTVLHADQILVLNHGEIVERGRHDSLLARGGFYTRLYRAQFAAEPTEAVVASY